MTRAILYPVLTLFASQANAASNLPSPAGSVMQMLLGLGVVLLTLFVALKFLRRLQSNTRGNPISLKVLGATAVGPREKVVVVAVGPNKVLVLGVAPGRVSRLHRMDASEFPAIEEPPKTAVPDFANRLKQMMERRNAS